MKSCHKIPWFWWPHHFSPYKDDVLTNHVNISQKLNQIINYDYDNIFNHVNINQKMNQIINYDYDNILTHYT